MGSSVGSREEETHPHPKESKTISRTNRLWKKAKKRAKKVPAADAPKRSRVLSARGSGGSKKEEEKGARQENSQAARPNSCNCPCKPVLNSHEFCTAGRSLRWMPAKMLTCLFLFIFDYIGCLPSAAEDECDNESDTAGRSQQ